MSQKLGERFISSGNLVLPKRFDLHPRPHMTLAVGGAINTKATKEHVVGTHWNYLIEAIPMRTHNTFFLFEKKATHNFDLKKYPYQFP